MDTDALQKLLIARRKEIDPAKHGLHRGLRTGRRAGGKGLTQADIDFILNLGSGVYGRLESGNYPNPSVRLLEDVARFFDLNEEEWDALNIFARGTKAHQLHATSSLTLPGGWQDAVDCYNAMAYLTDHRWNVLAGNQHWADLFPRREIPANTMRWMLTCPEARTVLIDWDTAWAPRVCPQLRAARAALPHDDGLADLEAEVLDDPDAGPIYETVGDITIHPDGAERPIRHAEQGAGWVSMYAAAPLSAPYARLMVMTFHAGDKPQNTDRPPLRAPDTVRDLERIPPKVPGIPGRHRRTDG